MSNETNIPPKKNIPIPPEVKTMPNIQKYSNNNISLDTGDLNENNNLKKSKRKLNDQAKSILLAMFSAICFIGAISCFVLMLVL